MQFDFKETNKVAYNLASLTCTVQGHSIWIKECPMQIMSLVLKDIQCNLNPWVTKYFSLQKKYGHSLNKCMHGKIIRYRSIDGIVLLYIASSCSRTNMHKQLNWLFFRKKKKHWIVQVIFTWNNQKVSFNYIVMLAISSKF